MITPRRKKMLVGVWYPVPNNTAYMIFNVIALKSDGNSTKYAGHFRSSL